MVLLVLAGVWALFLVPQVLRTRAERPADSIGAFSRQLSVLGRTGASAGSPHPPLFPVDDGPGRHLSAAEARRRRRDVVKGLLIAMGATLVLGLLPSLRVLLLVHLVLDLLFAGYVFLLHRAHVAALERRAKVRQLRAPPDRVPGSRGDLDDFEDRRAYGT